MIIAPQKALLLSADSSNASVSSGLGKKSDENDHEYECGTDHRQTDP